VTRRGPILRLLRVPLLTLLLAVSLGAGACATVHPYFDYASEPDPRKQEFVLGPADVVRISVWKNTDFSTEAIIRPDQMITMPLLGDVRAGGRTTTELRAEIAQKLVTYLKDETATVTVSLQAMNSYRFAVLGNAEHAGTFGATHFLTVSEAMALAGGPNRFGSADQMVIIRADAKQRGGFKRIPIDYPAILDGTHPEQDLAIVTGDVLYIP
jgi:polysaccharide export outer membrane protein